MASFGAKIKHHGTSIAFVLGFIWDNIMLTSVDHVFANVMLGSYLGLSAISILTMNMSAVSGRSSDEGAVASGHAGRGGLSEKLAKWLPLILQFCFGSLFSAYIIFYTR
ncbi:MAG: hypothetical protein Q7R65_03285, partial [bacterium]|nr:hypothetical protein [bacterium]